ncbi:MAG: hypothetical protein V4635_06735 [Bacteroidota bacterium]
MSKIHIGKRIREVLDKSAFTVVDFAKSINLSRDGAYKIFAKEYIDTDQLKQISKVLKHDFFGYYSADLPELKDPANKYGPPSRDEFESLKRLIESLEKKLDERLPEKKIVKKRPGKK